MGLISKSDMPNPAVVSTCGVTSPVVVENGQCDVRGRQEGTWGEIKSNERTGYVNEARTISLACKAFFATTTTSCLGSNWVPPCPSANEMEGKDMKGLEKTWMDILSKWSERKGQATAISEDNPPRAGRFFAVLLLDYYRSFFGGRWITQTDGAVFFILTCNDTYKIDGKHDLR